MSTKIYWNKMEHELESVITTSKSGDEGELEEESMISCGWQQGQPWWSRVRKEAEGDEHGDHDQRRGENKDNLSWTQRLGKDEKQEVQGQG